jgi:hypothetical protein
MHRRPRVRTMAIAIAAAASLFVSQGATAGGTTDYEFASPLFGLHAARGGGLLVADAGAGVVKLRGSGSGKLIAELPGVTDAASITRRSTYALTGAPDSMLYRARKGHLKPVADIGAFEAAVNPDGGEIDSNAFGVAPLSHGRALVSDAAGNSLLMVRRNGSIDWVATLPDQLVPTANVKDLVGCPYPAPADEPICDLPPKIPAQPVATSVAIGPDGAWYVGELKGFPAPTGKSRVWRIERGTRHAECGSSPQCSVVADGFTSIIDLGFGRDGSLHVVELDEDSFLAVEFGIATIGTINSCDVSTGDCEVLTNLFMPTAVASTRKGIFATVAALVPGQATVIRVG